MRLTGDISSLCNFQPGGRKRQIEKEEQEREKVGRKGVITKITINEK